MKKIICIDWFNTLSNSPYFFDKEKGEVFPLYEALFIKNAPLVKHWLKGVIDEDQIVHNLVSPHYDALKIKEYIKNGIENTKFYDSTAPSKIQRLRQRGFKVVLVTNIMDTFTENTIERLKLHSIFDAILASNKIGCLKTECFDSEFVFFTNFLAETKCTYQDLIVIDDDINLINLMKSQGAETFWIENIDQTTVVLDRLAEAYE